MPTFTVINTIENDVAYMSEEFFRLEEARDHAGECITADDSSEWYITEFDNDGKSVKNHPAVLPTIAGLPQNNCYPYDIFAVGDRCSYSYHTDIHPATVVEVKRNGREVVVRTDNAELAEGEKPEIIVGGFAGHCTNQRELKYDITENPDGALVTLVLRKWRGRYVWTHKNNNPDGCQRLTAGWRKFYDYNF